MSEQQPPTRQPKIGDKDYVGFDEELKLYYYGIYKFQPKTLSLNSKTKVVELMERHDDIGVELNNANALLADSIENAQDKVVYLASKESRDLQMKITELSVKEAKIKNEIVPELCRNMLLEEDGSPFDENKWFDSTDIPAGAWWDISVDMYRFLAVRGSKAEKELLLTPSKTA